ncbi:unnamed protein product [Rotaria socialis]|uniref:Uncharacterized protein n=2 Tax=Rotaria socialis TaxID=392032 RepID=A0A817ZB22_9BILA|nr:unnamed protein product [Rotaria socialis]CAF3390814.1 unnamed protein product [Rotaria socialis]CAF3402701.1 unnamed protein product [Rotaria socialis]CAF3544718.1 unnamed protein product [Rotaria socialis]CAF4140436.1 unnamed protein product [Rotaria socialis]
MTLTSSIAMLVLLMVATSIEAVSESSSEPVVHEGQCPSYNSPFQIMCRRRVCLPEELIPLCKMDGDCATTHKCCRPLCSCRVRCVEAVSA